MRDLEGPTSFRPFENTQYMGVNAWYVDTKVGWFVCSSINYDDDVQRVLINAKFLCPSSPVPPDNKEEGKIKILAQLRTIILVLDIE